MPARKPDRNRQALIVCEPCGYKLRGSRTQLVRGIPACPLCGEPMLAGDALACAALNPETFPGAFSYACPECGQVRPTPSRCPDCQPALARL